MIIMQVGNNKKVKMKWSIFFKNGFHLFFKQRAIAPVSAINQDALFIIMYNDTVSVFPGANVEQVNFHVAVVWTKIKVFKYIPFPLEQKLIFSYLPAIFIHFH